MKYVIELDEKRFKDIQRIASIQIRRRSLTCEQIIANGTPFEEELEKIKAEICKKHKIDCDLKCRECIYYPCLDSGASYIADIKILDKHIKKLKGENND